MGRSRSASRDRRTKKRAPSRSESGTPDWLRKRRDRASRGELQVRDDFGSKGGGKGGFGGKGGDKGGGKEPKPGDWACPSCNANNFARRTDCFKCGTPKPAGGGGDFGRGGGGGGGRHRSRSRS